ncbi:MAG: N5,N10-methylene tetrahydromethanopterin reductase [Acidimicrobiales bacterium]|nr:MAG: N5,N10-methylene tetrahydromethanopterin reductase [Acidimicrobiales bacterium]
MDLRLGTVLPSRELALASVHDPSPIVALAADLDTAGVDSLWVGESITARPRIDTYTLLAAVAAVTSDATLGTAVLLPALRNPVAFAHQVAGLDRLAQGRLVVGVGAGFPGPDTQSEFAALGADYHRRVSGTEATLTAARAIWRAAATGEQAADPTGRFGFDGVAITPAPTTTDGPPTWLATATPGGLRRCGEHHDGWLPYPPEPADYAAGLAQVRSAADAAGRDPNTIDAGLYVTAAIGSGTTSQQRLDDYCNAYYGGPSDLVGLIQALVPGTLTQVVDRLSAYIEAGARHLVIRHATLDPTLIADEAQQLHDAVRARYAGT